jgi:DNA-binding NarL/FixJ family response regulator
MTQKSVVIVDDHPIVSLAVSLSFRDHEDLSLAGTANTIAAALSLLDTVVPEALIVDLTFAGNIDVSILRQFRQRAPVAAIIVFSSLPESLYADEAIANGADAYVSKDKDIVRLIEVLRQCLTRPAHQPRHGHRDEPARTRHLQLETVHLTPREKEIARHISEGRSVAEIARRVGVSANTIAAHRDNLRRKLDCRDSTELVARLARLYSPGVS